MSKGRLIAGMSIAGAGKSDLFSRLEKLVPDSRSFCEPEEKDWGRAVKNRGQSGPFTGIHWFRAERVPKLYDARSWADGGHVSFVDTYYDKLCAYYLGKPGMEWLIAPGDRYFDNYMQTAKLDLEYLPEADALIAISVSEDDWRRMVCVRGRQLDSDSELLKTYSTQAYFLDAAKAYCNKTGAKLVEFRNEFGDPDRSADRLLGRLKMDGIV